MPMYIFIETCIVFAYHMSGLTSYQEAVACGCDGQILNYVSDMFTMFEIASSILLSLIKLHRSQEPLGSLVRSDQNQILVQIWHKLFILRAAYWGVDLVPYLQLNSCFYNPFECNLLINAIQLCRNLNLDQSERITLEKALIIEAWNKMQSRKSIDPIDSGLINQSPVADITSSEGLTHHLQGPGADTNSRELIHHLQGQGPVTERNSRELIHHLQGQGLVTERNSRELIHHLQGQGPVTERNSRELIHHLQGQRPVMERNSRELIHHLQGQGPGADTNSRELINHLQGQGLVTERNSRELIHHLQGQGPGADTNSRELIHHLQGQGPEAERNLGQGQIDHLQGQGPVVDANSGGLIHHFQGPEADTYSKGLIHHLQVTDNTGQGQIDHLQGQGPVMDANLGGLIHHFQGPEADTNSRGFIHHLQGSVPESNSGQGLDHLLPVANFTNLYERNVYRILFQYVLNDIPIGQIIEFL
ncbi:hypothetical protein M8J77_008835 [Diaphorina citri]|nr:hypothetical protein M8J77_008835 [Diaphorina citri]